MLDDGGQLKITRVYGFTDNNDLIIFLQPVDKFAHIGPHQFRMVAVLKFCGGCRHGAIVVHLIFPPVI